jgi:hypothetical protein
MLMRRISQCAFDEKMKSFLRMMATCAFNFPSGRNRPSDHRDPEINTVWRWVHSIGNVYAAVLMMSGDLSLSRIIDDPSQMLEIEISTFCGDLNLCFAKARASITSGYALGK